MATTPAQVNNLFKTLGARIAEAHNAAKDIPVDTGGGVGLPGGINNGVFQLTVLEFIEGKKEEDKGKYYFRAAGVVVSPQYHDGIKVAGKQTSVLIPFFDTPKRQNKKSFINDHWPTYRDLFEKLGVKQPPAQQPGESKDAASARIQQYYAGATDILLKQRPYCEFRTWQPPKATSGPYKDKESQVMELWGTRCEFVPQGAASNPAAGIAAAPTLPTNNGHVAEMNPPSFVEPPMGSPQTQTAPAQGAAPPPTTGQTPQHQPDDSNDKSDLELLAFAEAADADPDQVTDEAKEAVLALSAACKRHGVTPEEASAVTDWTAVVGLIRAKRDVNAATTPTPTVNGAERPIPVKGALVIYNGQAGCEVTSVNPDAKTVTLKGVDKKAIVGADRKLLKIPFAQLA